MTRPSWLARARALLTPDAHPAADPVPALTGYPIAPRPPVPAVAAPSDAGAAPPAGSGRAGRGPRASGRRGPGRRRVTALAVVASLAAGAVAGACGGEAAAEPSDPTGPTAPTAPGEPRDVVTTTGTLDDGATWIIEVPEGWNGSLLLFGHGLVPPGEENPAQVAGDPLSERFLLQSGYALAGSSYAGTGFAIDDAVRDQTALLDVFEQMVGTPHSTIAWGQSLGGMLAVLLAERLPERIDGAVSLCGVLGGGVGLLNTSLDVLFTLKTLLAPDAPIELTGITDPFASIPLVLGALDGARVTPEGRARIALAAAMGDIPGWVDADEPAPAPEDVATQVANQAKALTDVTFLGIGLRADVEARMGGNPSTNVGVDYSRQLRRSSGRHEVEVLYEQAGLSLADDLRTLADAPRIAADPAAVDALAGSASFDGHLGEVPVLTLHDVADPLVPVEHEQAYAAAVRDAGDRAQLRQVFVDRAGHCTFSPAETVAVLQVMAERVSTGRYGRHVTDPEALDARAIGLGPELNAHLDDETGQPVATPPAFTRFQPGRFLRPS